MSVNKHTDQSMDINTCLPDRCNKEVSNVFLSMKFHSHVSQLVRRVIPWFYVPLVSLGELSSTLYLASGVRCYGRYVLCPPLPPSGPGSHPITMTTQVLELSTRIFYDE